MSLKDAMAHLDERNGSAVAYVFAFAALRLVDALASHGASLVDSLAAHVESVAFDVLRGGGSVGAGVSSVVGPIAGVGRDMLSRFVVRR